MSLALSFNLNLSRTEKFLIGAMIGAAGVLFVQHRYQIAINQSPSLPYTMFVIKKGEPVGRNDLVAFQWKGGLGYAPGVTMIKRVAAAEGDVVVRNGQEFFVNGDEVAKAIGRTKAGKEIKAAAGGRIPDGQFFVVATNPISLDSRYADFGNVNKREVIGRAYVVW